MASRSAELEIVRFKEDDIRHATGKLIYNFVEYSNIMGTDIWKRLWIDLVGLIKDHTALDVIWKAEGMDIKFSYFLDPMPLLRDEEFIYSTPEPKITFMERWGELLPSRMDHVSKIAEAIAWEMEDVYHLKVEKDPLTLIFPKEEYAKSIDRINATILQPIVGTN